MWNMIFSPPIHTSILEVHAMINAVGIHCTQLLGGSLWGTISAFLPAFFSLRKSPRDEKITSDHCGLFGKSTVSSFEACNGRVHACAVDEFDLGFVHPGQGGAGARSGTNSSLQNQSQEGSNPFGWDLHGLIMENSNVVTVKQKTTQGVDHESVGTVAPRPVFSEDEDEVSEDEDMVVSPLDDELNLSYVCSFNGENVLGTNPLTLVPIPSPMPLPKETEDEGYEGRTWKRAKSSNSRSEPCYGVTQRSIQTHNAISTQTLQITQGTQGTQGAASASSSNSLTPLSSPTVSTSPTVVSSEGSQGSPDKMFSCKVCDTQFTVKGYLTRHMKKHAANKPFVCPFFDEKASSKCHPTGGFSRRDTFKTHLKALHFVYPTGTRCGERLDKRGRCAGCFREFESNIAWLNDHVAPNSCEGMISRYR